MDNETYKKLLDEGCSIEYMDISLCNLKNYLTWYKRSNKSVYQVHSNTFTQVYKDPNEAIEKFLELKRVKGRK